MTHPTPGLSQQQNIDIAVKKWNNDIAKAKKNIEYHKKALEKLKEMADDACSWLF